MTSKCRLRKGSAIAYESTYGHGIFIVTPALKRVQAEQPVYANGATGFWHEVIRQTAEGAGAEASGMLSYISLLKTLFLYCVL